MASNNSTKDENSKTVDANKGEEVTSAEKFDFSSMTDFELADIVRNTYLIKRIDNELYGFNGKHFVKLGNRELNQLVLSTFQSVQKQIRSTRKVRAIVDALYMLNFVDEQENDHCLGFQNGVLNLENWTFYEFSKGFPPPTITYTINSAYSFTLNDIIRGADHPAVTTEYLDKLLLSFPPTPVADKFFNEIANYDAALVRRIYEMIGYILVPDTTAKSFFLLQGVPHSGKSVLGRFIEGFFPKGRVTALDISRLSGQYLPKSLATSRLNLSMDLPDGLLPKKAVAMLKMLTGDDLATLESKYKEAISYRGQCKFLFSINGKLRMQGRDKAFLDRIVCIPFTKTVPMEKWDTQLRSKLESEREAIMMKSLLYYRVLATHNRVFSGKDRFLPEIEIRLTANETIEEFVKEKCDFTDVYSSYTETLYDAYIAFCANNGLKAIGSKSGFAQRLAALFPTEVRPSRWRDGVKNYRGFDGILLKQNPNEYDVIKQRSFDEYDNSDDWNDGEE